MGTRGENALFPLLPNEKKKVITCQRNIFH